MSWFTLPYLSRRRAAALTVLVSAAVSSHAQHAPAAAKRPARVEDKNAPVILQGEEMSGRPEREINIDRAVEVVHDQTRVTADTACYRQVENEVDASGRVHLWRFTDQYTGDVLKLNLDSGEGFIVNPTYRIDVGGGTGQGKAKRIDFINQDEAQVVNGTYSTCEGPKPDWYLSASTLDLDTGRDVGAAGRTVVYFKGVPILGTPALSFSLSGARRSGWLAPIPGYGSKGGAELAVPYYFDIAPNRDLTLTPKIIPNRGLQSGALARYIGETGAGTYAGQTYIEFLAHDKQTDTDRWLVNSTHTEALTPAWRFSWDLHGASDDNYPTDFSKTVASSVERQLLRELRTDYRGEHWNLSARVQNYQVLQDPAAAQNPSLTVPRPYDRLPDINFHSGQSDVAGGFDWSFDAEATRFWHPALVRGDRVVAVPQISYPWVQPAYFITPKLLLNAAAYQLDNNAVTEAQFAARAPSHAIPTFSLDSGMVFERDAKLFGREVTQTLEPRLFYVFTPYRDQSNTPNFDSALATFNFSQIFSENRFVGNDRIGDANQLTAALTTRFFEASGAERLRLALGQRFYFSPQQVRIDASPVVNDTHSDILLAASGRISPTWGIDSATEYNPTYHRTESANYSVQWQPGPKKVLNVAWRYQRLAFKNAELSSQWPLSQRLYGVGRVSYSLQDKKLLESLIGLEYKGDCWIFRMGAQRFVAAANTSSTALFFQLELSGLSKFGVGNSPLEEMTKGIPGYQRLNSNFTL